MRRRSGGNSRLVEDHVIVTSASDRSGSSLHTQLLKTQIRVQSESINSQIKSTGLTPLQFAMDQCVLLTQEIDLFRQQAVTVVRTHSNEKC